MQKRCIYPMIYTLLLCSLLFHFMLLRVGRENMSGPDMTSMIDWLLIFKYQLSYLMFLAGIQNVPVKHLTSHLWVPSFIQVCPLLFSISPTSGVEKNPLDIFNDNMTGSYTHILEGHADLTQWQHWPQGPWLVKTVMLGAFTWCSFFSTPLQVPGSMMEPVGTMRSRGPCWNWSTSWTGLTLVETSKFWWPPTALTPWTLPSWGPGVWTERLSLVFPIWRSVACAGIVDRFCAVLFSALEQTHCTLVACDSKWVTAAFYSMLWISTVEVYLSCCLVVTQLVPHETPAVSALSMYTIQPCIMSCHFMQSHMRWMHPCLAVTCYYYYYLYKWTKLIWRLLSAWIHTHGT